MKTKMRFVSLLSASLLLAACGETTTEEETTTDDTEQVETIEEETATEEPATEESDSAEDTEEEADTEEESEGETREDNSDDQALEGSTLKYGYGAPHGTKSFSATFVGLEDDTITHAFIDEFQFMGEGDWSGVPNNDGAFAEGYENDSTLISKVENDEDYSAMMEENAGATMTLGEGYQAISDFAVGKTISEVEDAISELNGLDEDQAISDVVSGATLVDTAGYLQAIVDVANDGYGVEATDSISDAEFSYSLQAPHGDKSFAIVGTLTSDDTVLAAVQDEFQFLDGAEFTGVPNSDDEFGDAYADDLILASKVENDDGYSAMMEENADAEHTYLENMQAILDFTQGKMVSELEEAVSELEGQSEEDAVADVVSGATFVDTAGYLQAIIDTVQQ